MKQEFAKLNVGAFGLSGGVIGLAWGLLMGGFMGPSWYGAGYDLMSSLGMSGLMGVWVAVVAGIASALFAWIYNALALRAA